MHITCVILFVYNNKKWKLIKLYPIWWWPQEHWPKHVIDKLYTPANIVVSWMLYPYRIITLGSNKHKGDDAPWNWKWRQRVTNCEGLTTYTLHDQYVRVFVENETSTATYCKEGLWKYSAVRQQQLLVTPQGVVFIHYASPWPRMIYSLRPVWVMNV